MEPNFLRRIFFLAVGLQISTLLSFGQSTPYAQQLWMQESALNPAASGLFTKIDAYAGFSSMNANNYYYDMTQQSYVGLINVKLANLNSGLGISFNRKNLVSPHNTNISETESYTSFENFRINYNYQFRFKDQGTLSLGATLMYQNYNWNNYRYGFCGNDSMPLNGDIQQSGIGFGAIYARPKWHIGFSVSPTFVMAEQTSQYISLNTEYSLIGAYSFDISIKTTLAPYLYLAFPGTNFYLASASSLGLRLEHDWFLAGIAISGEYFTYLDGTIGVTLYKSYSLIYTMGFVLDIDDVEPFANHSIGVRYNFVK